MDEHAPTGLSAGFPSQDSPPFTVDLTARREIPGPLTDRAVESQRDIRRAIMVARLENLWEWCQHNMDPAQPVSVDQVGRGPDPRYGELGLRVLDRLTKLYRLTETGPKTIDGPSQDERDYHRGRVLDALDELSRRAQ